MFLLVGYDQPSLLVINIGYLQVLLSTQATSLLASAVKSCCPMIRHVSFSFGIYSGLTRSPKIHVFPEPHKVMLF